MKFNYNKTNLTILTKKGVELCRLYLEEGEKKVEIFNHFSLIELGKVEKALNICRGILNELEYVDDIEEEFEEEVESYLLDNNLI